MYVGPSHHHAILRHPSSSASSSSTGTLAVRTRVHTSCSLRRGLEVVLSCKGDGVQPGGAGLLRLPPPFYHATWSCVRVPRVGTPLGLRRFVPHMGHTLVTRRHTTPTRVTSPYSEPPLALSGAVGGVALRCREESVEPVRSHIASSWWCSSVHGDGDGDGLPSSREGGLGFYSSLQRLSTRGGGTVWALRGGVSCDGFPTRCARPHWADFKSLRRWSAERGWGGLGTSSPLWTPHVFLSTTSKDRLVFSGSETQRERKLAKCSKRDEAFLGIQPKTKKKREKKKEEVKAIRDNRDPVMSSTSTSSPSSSSSSSLLGELLSRWKPIPDLLQHAVNACPPEQKHEDRAIEISGGEDIGAAVDEVSPLRIGILKARRRRTESNALEAAETVEGHTRHAVEASFPPNKISAGSVGGEHNNPPPPPRTRTTTTSTGSLSTSLTTTTTAEAAAAMVNRSWVTRLRSGNQEKEAEQKKEGVEVCPRIKCLTETEEAKDSVNGKEGGIVRVTAHGTPFDAPGSSSSSPESSSGGCGGAVSWISKQESHTRFDTSTLVREGQDVEVKMLHSAPSGDQPPELSTSFDGVDERCPNPARLQAPPHSCSASPSTSTTLVSSSVIPLEDPLVWLQQEDDGEEMDGSDLSAAALSSDFLNPPPSVTPLEDQLRSLEAYYLHPSGEEENKMDGGSCPSASSRRRTTESTRSRGDERACPGESKVKGNPNSVECQSARTSGTFLVFNIFTRRVVQATSGSIQRLRCIGIGVDRGQRQLYLENPEMLIHFVEGMRNKTISWPTSWSSTVFHRLRRLLESTKEPSDAPERVQGFLHHYQTITAHGGQVSVIDAWQALRSHPDPHLYAAPSARNAANTSGAVTPVATAATATSAERLLSESDLTEEQRRVLNLALDGHHLYIGGSAGTGKSVLLRVLRRRLVEEGLSVAVTATTGLAAFHIGGTTLHHRFGISLDGRIRARAELLHYDAIIIDEVSMLPRALFEELERQLRLAHRNQLPFGGVQIILCGDFMQLGAIAAETIVNAPVFRQNFVMLKLLRSLRQEKNPVFFLHLQALRLGKMLPSWKKTVQFIDTYQHVAQIEELEMKQKQENQQHEREHEERVLERQVEQLGGRSTLDDDGSHNDNNNADNDAISSLPPGTIVLPPLPENTHESLIQSNSGDSASELKTTSTTTAPATGLTSLPAIIVEDAVNLLPTNALVRQANDILLSKLEGESVEFPAMVLTPFVQDKWSSSYLLAPSAIVNNGTNPVPVVDLEAVRRALLQFVLSCVASITSKTSINPVQDEDVEDLRLHPERHILVYQLYEDGYVFRVRIPLSLCDTPTESVFLAALDYGLNTFLKSQSGLIRRTSETADNDSGGDVCGGLCQRETLQSAEGLHTEQDEFILQQYVMRSQMVLPLVCKVGARVMLRTNLSRQLVNGSVGTIVGFVEMKAQNLSAYQLRSCPHREEAIQQYANFLCYEHGFSTPLMPLVDFGDGQAPVAIPPVHFPVGGFANTHFYTGGTLAIPLTLAYAFTVHKVQGLTLVGRVHLELSRMWPCEHLLYVAMSRVKNPEQLSISNFHISLLRVAADCLLFDQSLPSVDSARVLPHFIPATWIVDPSRRKRALNRKRRQQSRERSRRFAQATSPHSVTQPAVVDACDIEAIQSLFLSRLAAR